MADTRTHADASITQETGPILRARGLCKTYRLGRVSVPVLQGVDVEIERGACVAVLGASGSGKSTLLHLLGGLDRPTDGTIEFEGSDLAKLGARGIDRYRNLRVGFVFQFYHLLPELDVLRNAMLPALVGLGRVAYASRRREIEGTAKELLEVFGLGHRLKHRPVELSGGERQRVAIARALVNRPAVLLADEPTGNLDHATGVSILDAMMASRDATGQTMVIVTHDQATAERADRIIELRDGQIASV